MALPSDETLRSNIRAILSSSNLTEMTPKLLRRQLEQKLGRNEGEFDEEAIKARITVIMNEEVEALGLPDDAGDQVEEERPKAKARKASKPAPPKRSRSGSRRRKDSDEEDEEDMSEEEEEEAQFESDDEDKPKRKRRPPPPRPKKPAVQRNPEKNAEIERLKKIIRAAGLRVKGVVEDDDETIRNLSNILISEGLGTRPSKEKIREFKKKRDIERETLELNTKNIIGDLNRRSTRGRTVSYAELFKQEDSDEEQEEGGGAAGEGTKAEGGEGGAAGSEEKPAKKQRKEDDGDQQEEEDGDDFNPEEEGEEED